LTGIIKYSVTIRYSGLQQFLLSNNLKFLILDEKQITTNLAKNLAKERVVRIRPDYLFICLLLGFTPKPDSTLRRAHYLSYPERKSLNTYINPKYSTLEYIKITNL
jgi:hypothetical protein